MLREQKTNSKKIAQAGRIKYPGICQAAADLGVSRIHLYYVVIGERRSPRIESSEWLRAIRSAS